MKRIFLVWLVAMAASGCGKQVRVQVVQRVVVGSPGTGYKSTENRISLDVVNNSQSVGDVLVGETVVYPGLNPGEVRNIGFDCNDGAIYVGLIRFRRSSGRGSDRREEFVYFSPRDGRPIISKQMTINCDYDRRRKEKEQMIIPRNR